ncbi:MAG: glycoside hydrolase family 127 protein, partial [Sedimentisphaerales bacterium]|nr:glycoside hydrolase family 127 protein [Sedimentisphaerales bacterium]
LQAIDRIWENVVSKKLYLTGGIGATGQGEALGKDYELPNATAYCETCASIGNVMWNHRMFLSHGDAKYIDVLERTLYNGLISGVSLSGDRFFYPNPLESRGQHKRIAWFPCACCPGNIAKFIPQVPGYIYAQQENKIYVNLFVDNSAAIKMGDNSVRLSQKTRYPWDGNVKITVEPERPEKFTLCIRIPSWAQDKPVPSNLYRYMDSCSEKANLKVNGKLIDLNMEKGFACIEREWKKGDVIELNLPMPVRRVLSHEKVEANAGKVALQRGPIVYCAEGIDNGGHVLNLLLPDDAKLMVEHKKNLLNGVTVIRGRAVGLSYGEDGETLTRKQQNFVAIPYYAWANRRACEMAVWLARNESAAQASTTRLK